ncbi:lipopolysaccharide assembly protein LapA domain-containing protein [Microaerobacter geothermalis]|uniref:LapA family protein n=1 Tax=Microaerobacter geothermalis TaxID=674972 RepID=UPI001F37D842|nr:lipopolysaccharide assembly protein LapA domain-containing protein [Microaerobacter geothermalis]MCF6092762.1 lipopolysaccharide assembly protein LapA domain-containing protein [Microaerobacter geothermalis]
MRLQWNLILSLIFALVIAIFAVVNVNSVEVNFLFTLLNIPLIIVILTSTLIGGLIVGLYGIFRQYSLQREIKRLRNRIVELEEEISSHAEGKNKAESKEIMKEDEHNQNQTNLDSIHDQSNHLEESHKP